MDALTEEKLTDLAFDKWFEYSNANYVGGTDIMDYEIDFENRTMKVIFRPYNPVEAEITF